jgi:hypothetical protein
MNDLHHHSGALRAALACLALVTSGLSSGCLTTPAAPQLAYIEPVALAATDEDSRVAGAAQVRLVEVFAAEGARDSLSWRDGLGRVWRDESTRWSRSPSDFVRQLVELRVASPTAASAERRLTLEIVFFGARLEESGASAEIELFATVEDARGALLLARTFRSREPLQATLRPGSGDVAELAVALGGQASRLVDDVLRAAALP